MPTDKEQWQNEDSKMDIIRKSIYLHLQNITIYYILHDKFLIPYDQNNSRHPQHS